MSEPAENLEPDASETAEQAEAQSEESQESGQSEDIQLYPGGAEPQPAEFGELSYQQGGARSPMDLLLDVELQLAVELGRTVLTLKDVLELAPGSVVELQRMAGEPVDVSVNKKLIARGEVVVIDEKFGVRITEIVSPSERLDKVR